MAAVPRRPSRSRDCCGPDRHPFAHQGGAGAEEESIITAAAEQLCERFPAMFKPSTNCRPPHLNVDVLRNEMHKAGLVQRLGMHTGDELVTW